MPSAVLSRSMRAHWVAPGTPIAWENRSGGCPTECPGSVSEPLDQGSTNSVHSRASQFESSANPAMVNS